jgi:zinc transporter 2
MQVNREMQLISDESESKINFMHLPNKSEVKESNSKSDLALRKLIIISLICSLFLITEIIGGILANSLAIISDAAHLLSDLSGFFISIIAIWIGKKKANNIYTFGYYRAEVIGALISVITIWLLTAALLKEAFERIIKPSEIYSPAMILTAIIGLICNLAMMKVLHSKDGHCHHNHNLDQLVEINDYLNISINHLHRSSISTSGTVDNKAILTPIIE